MATDTKLTLAEELVLIALDDTTGRLYQSFDSSPMQFNIALSGALLMELALERRIDTDSEHLFVLSPDPLGSTILDEILAEIVARNEPETIEWWLLELAGRAAEDYLPRLIGLLVGRGILKEQDNRLLWVFKFRAYPPTTGREEREVKARISALLYGDEIPDPRDALLVGLLHATRLFPVIFSSTEVESLTPRIEKITRLEAIGRTLVQTISTMQAEAAMQASVYH